MSGRITIGELDRRMAAQHSENKDTLDEIRSGIADLAGLVRVQNGRVTALETNVAVLKTKLAVLWSAAAFAGGLVGTFVLKMFGK